MSNFWEQRTTWCSSTVDLFLLLLLHLRLVDASKVQWAGPIHVPMLPFPFSTDQWAWKRKTFGWFHRYRKIACTKQSFICRFSSRMARHVKQWRAKWGRLVANSVLQRTGNYEKFRMRPSFNQRYWWCAQRYKKSPEISNKIGDIDCHRFNQVNKKEQTIIFDEITP